MSVIQKRMQRCEELQKEIENHPMCERLIITPACVTVIYPSLDFMIDGVKCSFQGNKSEAFEKVLKTIERHWVESVKL